MPRFLHPDAAALNTLVSAKRKVVKRNRKKYEGMDAAYQQEMANLAQSQQGASVIFDGLLNLLTTIDAGALEIKATLQLAGTTGGRIGFADRFLASNSVLLKSVTQLQQQMQKLGYSFNIFSEVQMKELYAKYTSIVTLLSEAQRLIESYRRRRNSEWIGEAWNQLTTWFPTWLDVSQRMAGAFKSYKYGLASVAQQQGAGRRRSDRVIGGQGPAGREPFQYTTFASNLGAHPPRNTQDLPYLPRRFL